MARVRISVRDLSFSYGSSQENVLEGINFSIYDNEIITIIGPNGGGKSTLLRLMIGLIKPDRGVLQVRGNIGYVPQHAGFDRHFPMTAFDVVLSGLVHRFGFYSRKDRIMAEKSLENVGLSSVRNKPVKTLSGGQTQRMLIARALVSDKDILLLDEPTSSIDPMAGSQLYSLIKTLSKKMTIVLVTHDTSFVSDITDRVFCVNRKLKEHPADSNFGNVIASAYGQHSRIVRHDLNLQPNILDSTC